MATTAVHAITHPKKRAFLASYARCGNIAMACRAAGVSRRIYYVWTEGDAAFAAAAGLALADAGDYLEEVAFERATVGVQSVKEVYERGQPIAYDVATREPCLWAESLVRREVSRTISDTMLAMLLNGAKPEKYKRRLEHSGAIGGSVKVLDREAWEAL